jgi:hypothetical protein
MPKFQKTSDCALEGELTIIAPAADVIVPVSGSVEVAEPTASELRSNPYVEEVTAEAPKAEAKKESK